MTTVKQKRVKTGGRKPGSLNKTTHEIRALAQKYGGLAMASLVATMQTATSESARIAAANSILDRAYGKPTPLVDVESREMTPDMTGWKTERICAYLGITPEEWAEHKRRVQDDY